MTIEGKKGLRGGLVDKENIIQAVVIADSYDDSFSPACGDLPPCLMPLVNRPMLDYTLECLSAAGVQEVILFCSSFADKTKEFIRERRDRFGDMSITHVVSEGCRSLGDAIRDLDGKALIRTDFILLSGTVVGTLDLVSFLDKHRKICKVDKGAAMTVLYKECGNKIVHQLDNIYLAIDSKTDRILYHSKKPAAVHHSTIDSNISLPLELLLERRQLEVRCDLVDTGVSICSVSVPPLFSDNFDFQTREDFIRGLLMNEEILASTLYSSLLPPPQYAAEATHFYNYHTISRDIIHRWTYPQVPGGFIDDMYSYRFGNLYLQNNVSMETGSKLRQDVVVGRDTSLGANTQVSSSVIGKSCKISSDVVINNSHLFDNIVIESGCVIESSVISSGCVIKSKARVVSCILGPGVVVPFDKCLDHVRLQGSPINKDDEGVGDNAFEYRSQSSREEVEESDSSDEDNYAERPDLAQGLQIVQWIGLDPPTPVDWTQFDETIMQSEDGDTLSAGSTQPDDTNLFFSEVIDSLSRGLEDRLPCDNLVLEVNSSRYAYNVSLREVNYHVCRAVLSLHTQVVLAQDKRSEWDKVKSTVDYFTPLLTNYIKNQEAMFDCLSAIEDICETREELRPIVVKVMSHLYEKDIITEESILEWHTTPRDSSAFSQQFRKLIFPFIKWLQEADEQSSEEDSDD